LCPRAQAGELEWRLQELPGVEQVLVAGAGGPARGIS
jgi:hypothetical protein